jgi:hypothetical protein
MNTQSVFGLGLVAALVVSGGGSVKNAAAVPLALGSNFTYQGQLLDSGAPATGVYDFEFRLFDSDGNPVGSPSTVTVEEESVSNGLFTVQLTFGGDAFTGQRRYLEIGVRPADSVGAYTTLSPRQELTPAPYALHAVTAGNASLLTCSACVSSDELVNSSVCTSQLAMGAVTGTKIADATITTSKLSFTPGTVTSIEAGAGLTGGAITHSGTIAVDFGTTSSRVATGNHNHDTTYWRLSGNTTGGGEFIGTINNHPLDLRVNNSRVLRLEQAGLSFNVIGGHPDNDVSPGAVAATIGGGGLPVPGNNLVTDDFGTVAGGVNNRAGDNAAADRPSATVGGGASNTASGDSSTVSGGQMNTASGTDSTVGGGEMNRASGLAATVGGGSGNTATFPNCTVAGGTLNAAGGFAATVPGGFQNAAEGSYSFAAGRRAQANHPGAFVWADSTDADFASTATDQFAIRASNGVRLSEDAGAAKAIDVGDRYRDNAIVAWAKISAAGNRDGEFGVSSVAHAIAGVYAITLDASAANASTLIPVAIAEVDAAPANAASVRIVSVNQTGVDTFSVYINDGNFNLVNNDFVFMVTAR